MSVQDRLQKYLSLKHLTNKEFEDLTGLANAASYRLSESSRKSTFERISDALPDLDIEWLKTGQGEMLKEYPIDEAMEPSLYDQFQDVPQKYITYLVPVAAMGGTLMDFTEDGVSRNRCEKIISPIAGIDLVIPVCGDSMEPEYPNGSYVYVKEINHYDFIAWGNVYVLDTTNGIIVKVVEQSDREDCVRCVSLNPSKRYAPFNVPMRTIRRMYKVVLCASLK